MELHENTIKDIEAKGYNIISFHEDNGRVILSKNGNEFTFVDVEILNECLPQAISDFKVSFDTTNDTTQIELSLNDDFAIDIRNEGFNRRTDRFYSTWFIEDVDILVDEMKDLGKLPQDFTLPKVTKQLILEWAVTSEWTNEEIKNQMHNHILEYVEEDEDKFI